MATALPEPILFEARQFKNELVAKMARIPTLSAAANDATIASAAPRLPSNILGVGYGAKETDGASVDSDLAVRIYVRSKLPRGSLSKREMIPSEVNGRATDVIAVGDIMAAQRPTKCGVSCGHFRVTAGTLGCVVRRRNGGGTDHFILSNNHVLANVNDAQEGDNVLEPGPRDGGKPNNPIAKLADFEPLRFDAANQFDAAIAKVIDVASVLPEITVIGAIQTPTATPAVHQSVRKHGRTTQHTVGVIRGLAEDVPVGYANGKVATFEDQLAIIGAGGDFGRQGDSGALIVDAVSRTPVALLFAVGGNTTFASRIGPVLDRFEVDIV